MILPQEMHRRKGTCCVRILYLIRSTTTVDYCMYEVCMHVCMYVAPREKSPIMTRIRICRTASGIPLSQHILMRGTGTRGNGRCFCVLHVLDGCGCSRVTKSCHV